MKKTIDDYAATILQYHVELQKLPPQHPDYEKIEDQLSRQLTAWSKKLNITVQVANNEQTPWQSEEIGYPCIPMSTKQASGTPQTGDYIAYLDDYDMFAGVLVERKGIAECSYGEYLSFKPAFNGKNYNKTNFGMNVAARRATIAKLISMGIDVHFSGTRQAAVELYHDLVLQWCRVNYKTILNID